MYGLLIIGDFFLATFLGIIFHDSTHLHSIVQLQLDRFLSDGLNQVLVDEEDKLEAGDLKHRIVAQTDLVAAVNLEKTLNQRFAILSTSRVTLTGLPSTNIALLPSLAM